MTMHKSRPASLVRLLMAVMALASWAGLSAAVFVPRDRPVLTQFRVDAKFETAAQAVNAGSALQFWTKRLQEVADSIAPPDKPQTISLLPLGRGLTVNAEVVTFRATIRVFNVLSPLTAQKSVESVWPAHLADPTTIQTVNTVLAENSVDATITLIEAGVYGASTGTVFSSTPFAVVMEYATETEASAILNLTSEAALYKAASDVNGVLPPTSFANMVLPSRFDDPCGASCQANLWGATATGTSGKLVKLSFAVKVWGARTAAEALKVVDDKMRALPAADLESLKTALNTTTLVPDAPTLDIGSSQNVSLGTVVNASLSWGQDSGIPLTVVTQTMVLSFSSNEQARAAGNFSTAPYLLSSILSYFGYLNGLPYAVTLSYPSGGGPSITDVAGSKVTVYLAASVFGTSESSSAIYLLDTELPRILPAERRVSFAEAISTLLPGVGLEGFEFSKATTYEASDYLPSASIGTQTPPSTFDAALRGIITMRLSGVELTQEQIGDGNLNSATRAFIAKYAIEIQALVQTNCVAKGEECSIEVSGVTLTFVKAATRRSLLAVTIDITSYVDGAPTLTTAEAALATIGTSFGGGTVESVVTTDSRGQVVGSGARALRAGATTALAAALLLLALAA